MPTGPRIVIAAAAQIHLGEPDRDAGRSGSWWLWGACDNLKVPVKNALRLAEKIL